MPNTQECQEWIDGAKKLLGKSKDPGLDGGKTGNKLAGWQSARSKVIASLKELEDRIRAMADPESDAAIMLVKAIQANLTSPRSLALDGDGNLFLTDRDVVRRVDAASGIITVSPEDAPCAGRSGRTHA